MTMSPLFLLYTNLQVSTLDAPNGDPGDDALIASTLGVASLTYTSNDANAQTLLPAGWSWTTDANGGIAASRNSDNFFVGGYLTDAYDAPRPVPTPLRRCLVAVGAQLAQNGLIS